MEGGKAEESESLVYMLSLTSMWMGGGEAEVSESLVYMLSLTSMWMGGEAQVSESLVYMQSLMTLFSTFARVTNSVVILTEIFFLFKHDKLYIRSKS